jgi:hypothetical protein
MNPSKEATRLVAATATARTYAAARALEVLIIKTSRRMPTNNIEFTQGI